MARVLSPECAAAFAQAHRSLGTELLFRTGVERLEGERGRVASVITTSGKRIPADLVLVGIGAAPRVELALQAGLPVDNGIVLDALLRTADPQVSAIGEVASFPGHDAAQRVRPECVQNATDQARAVAARLAGYAPSPYQAVPWFWSDQGHLKLQIAGLRGAGDERVVIGDATAGNFSVLCVSDGVLRAVESVNRPADHMLARKLLAKHTRLSLAQAREPGFTLKMLSIGRRSLPGRPSRPQVSALEELLSNVLLRDLPVARLPQIAPEELMVRPPIPRTAAFEVREHRVAIELLDFAPDHHGHTDFAPLRVRYAEHGDFRHRRPAAGA